MLTASSFAAFSSVSDSTRILPCVDGNARFCYGKLGFPSEEGGEGTSA